jgi:hypothetical protein
MNAVISKPKDITFVTDPHDTKTTSLALNRSRLQSVKALAGTQLKDREIEVDDRFMGFTVLSETTRPSTEYYVTPFLQSGGQDLDSDFVS